MKRQYRILYKRNPGSEFATLEPGAHRAIYDKPQVNEAIEVMRAYPYIVGLAVQVDVELFNIMSFTQEAEAPNAFLF
jgi:hypothetical protein